MEPLNKIKAVSKGFTLTELIVTIAVIGILAAVAIPAYSVWSARQRLHIIFQGMHADFKFAKTQAMVDERRYAVVFDVSDAGSYRIEDCGPDDNCATLSDNETVKWVDFKDLGQGDRIRYGHGAATHDATVSKGALPEDHVSYTSNRMVFNTNGTGKSGYVYLSNASGHACAIGTRSTGMIVLKKWNDDTKEWE